MAYRFEQDEPIGDGFVRIAREQLELALDESGARSRPAAERAHQVRKRCKKVRALLRLVRPSLDADTFVRENTQLRDAARTLADFRDASVQVATLDALLSAYDSAVEPGRFRGVRRALVQRRVTLQRHRNGGAPRLMAFRDLVGAVLKRAGEWRLDAEGFAALAHGLGRTYKRGRGAMGRAYHHRTPASFHEWRKAVKYGLYHHRLVCGAWPSELGGRRATVDHLAELLGLDHDLAVLREALAADPPQADGDVLEVVSGLAQRRRETLEAEAHPLGALLYAERTRDFVDRIQAYWDTWRGPQASVGA